jgi:hypothetical protein
MSSQKISFTNAKWLYVFPFLITIIIVLEVHYDIYKSSHSIS